MKFPIMSPEERKKAVQEVAAQMQAQIREAETSPLHSVETIRRAQMSGAVPPAPHKPGSGK